MTSNYDAVVVGAGYFGASVAHQLIQEGLHTALIERSGVASGASGANYGNIQIQDAEIDTGLDLVLEGHQRFNGLQEKLECDFGMRTRGSLLLAENETQWNLLSKRVPRLLEAGLDVEMVPADRLSELEPLLDHTRYIGASFHANEAQIYPFGLIWGFLHSAQKKGLVIHRQTELTGFRIISGRIQGVMTSQGEISTPLVILTTGAWTAAVGKLLGRDWAVRHTHSQALVTEVRHDLELQNHVTSATYFERFSDKKNTALLDEYPPPPMLAVAQSQHGNFLLGGAPAPSLTYATHTTPEVQAVIAREICRVFPALRSTKVLRGWGAPNPFSADGFPFLGPVSGIEGLLIAASMGSSAIVTPLVGEIVRDLVMSRPPAINISSFAPDRARTASNLRKDVDH
jgi:sarcosine oxidase, subunit beta